MDRRYMYWKESLDVIYTVVAEPERAKAAFIIKWNELISAERDSIRLVAKGIRKRFKVFHS
jgi:hypothetical protein